MGTGLGRRHFLKATASGAAIAALGTGASGAAQQAPQQAPQKTAPTAGPAPSHRPRGAPPSEARLFLTDPEAAFVAAAVDILIPKDDVGPGGVEAGVVTYVDRQLAGAWGNGDRMYLQGPWGEGTPQQGYQLPLTPARLFRIAIPEVDRVARESHGKGFAELPAATRNELMVGLDGGDIGLATIPGKVFMAMLQSVAIEGYFADPAYGGNKNMSAWRMIGFPGARGAYVEDIETYRGKPFPGEPVSLADLQ